MTGNKTGGRVGLPIQDVGSESSLWSLYREIVKASLQGVFMSRQERAGKIGKILEELYPDPPIPLEHSNTFTLLIAVLLSAQTTDVMVNRVTPTLFRRANTSSKMAKLEVEEIFELIRTCGLAPRKAKAIRDLSRILVEKHGGKVPCDFESLEELPGVGHKTASGTSLRCSGLSCRYPYPSTGSSLGSFEGYQRRTDRGGLEKGVSSRSMECPSPSDHLFRSRVLSCPGS